MGMFDGMDTGNDIEDSGDVIGGRGPLKSGLYDMAVEMAYVDKSKGGATSINLAFVGKNGEKLKVTEWVTSGDAKGGKNYYEKDGKKFYLPGFNTVNNLCLLTIGKPLTELDTEEKTVKIYDWDQKKEVPMQKQVIMDLLGQEITLGVQEQIVDKNVKNDKNVYVPSGFTRMENVVGKAFRTSDGLTVTEIKAEATEAAFKIKWAEANADKVIDRSAAKKGHIPGTPGSTPSAGSTAATPAPGKSLFTK